MPASLYGDMDHHGGGGLSMHHSQHSTNCSSGNTNCSVSSSNSGASLIDEDQRALQLALELSMLGLTDNTAALQLAASVADHQHHHQQQQLHHQQQQHLHHQQQQRELREQQQIHQQQQQIHHHNQANNSLNSPSDLYSSPSDMLPKKSQNMTECVPVPSSEHVAEIVGRQGCKIKALRAKTNTYIKTPVRGEEPVFVVTGRKEDVGAAKREILSAADHFSQIRASRKGGAGNGPSAPAPVPGQVTIQVRVPYRVVGLVVGPKGATIKRIQQQTHTYIVTPSRDKDPVFEVTGLPDNVQVAKREIEAHIAIRTGSFPMDNPNSMMGENEMTNPAEILANLYKNGISGLGLEGLGLGLGAINSLSSSLSSVNGLGAALAQNGAGHASAGSTSSGGGSLSSLSSLNGFSANPMAKMTNNGQMNEGGFYGHPALTDLGFSLMDNNTQNAFMSSSRSEDSYLFGNSGPNSIEEGSQSKLTDLFATTSVSSSLWGSFDRDEGLGESPTLESAPGSNLISLQ